eukprot:Phypoly_transcript_01096.p1 GENE.Phypoly_transcript_01096~~Phypoly_transcript_01096.p1  ORF type:complete len:1113 (-),score=285.59 Phypoly_transcript_01096:143-3481(-)
MSSTHVAVGTQAVFGQPLETIIKAQQARGAKSDVPQVITEIILWLESHQAITTKNIFRALGHASTVQQIKAEFEDGTWSASRHQRDDMHSIAAVLKVFLRELPEPLFPSKYYSLVLKIIRDVPDPVHQSYHLRVCVYSLPKPNRDSILFISNFLHRVAFNHKENGVDASTLAYIFAPYIFRPPSPVSADRVCIPGDRDYLAMVMRRLVDDAPFFFKTIPRPPGSPEGTSAPSFSFIQGKALYPYPGGSQWLLPLQKDDVVVILDIKNEDGWVKVMKGSVGYTPLSYVALIPLPPPSDDPHLRLGISPESDYAGGGEAPAPPPRNVTSPHLLPFSPESKQFSSPDLSHIHQLPPPPPLVFPPGTDASIPPPIDLSYIPPVNVPPPLSPLSGSLQDLPPPILHPSPRGGLSNSVPSLPALPPAIPPRNSPSKSSSFNNTVLPPAPSIDHPILVSPPSSHLLPKLTRQPSHSAPPPRLIAPQLPDAVRSPESERDDETATSTDYETDDYENSSEDVTGNAPPPAPALPSSSLLATSGPESEQDISNAKKRKERAEETLFTERTYVKQLTIVVECFVEPLKKKEREKTPILNGTDIFAIFSNIEVILNCHKKLLDMFEKRLVVWDSIPELGDIFLENTAFIKLYKYYVNNFDKSIITLKTVREKNPTFQQFAQEFDYSEKLSGLSIESFLILPVQRIPRYVLLLQDLLKYTNPTHQDFNNLSNALSFIKDLADFINSNKSDADNINKILGIQEHLTNTPDEFTLVVPRRKYIDEGTLLYKKQKAHIFLFSDALLFTKTEKKGNRFKALINLPTASLNITDEPGILKIISTEGTFKFGAETPKDREHWIKIIRETMDASRVEMLHSAFTDGNQTEGSNKQFMKLKEEEFAAKKRTLVDHLAASEQEYVDSMTYIRNTFLAPLRKAVESPMPMVALAELIDITSNLETLHNCHIIFLAAIKERVAEWAEKPYMWDLFTEKAAFLKLYNYYVTNHHKSLETIDVCIEKYPLFAVFLRELEAREKVELKNLLTEPLRRVSTYYLIVQELSQYIKPKTEEHEQVSKVVARLKEQTEKLNADMHVQSPTSRAGPVDKRLKDKTIERSGSARKFRISNNKEKK